MIRIDDAFIKRAHDYNKKAMMDGVIDIRLCIMLEAWLSDNKGRVFTNKTFMRKYTRQYNKAIDKIRG